ncbi:TetR/AcrR family transcriptional regulator [Nocardioides sp. AE5]|uniref:TetR/AcrR family transcriptional regulator n=1 Tax=Nocardioides sp. AE5 TaxID=2962573 RepID=UPI00288162F7|nr:TetR/AcrR family transcriptional regulator [Nocardioides sp. AE5]MDT0202725.1 TetR/AcrR family transcriptional regulator [Nocardioides sp. AE5]
MRDTRQQILAASADVFSRLGYAQTTIGDIAKAAGVTRPTVYAYFSSKDEVFQTLAENVRHEFRRIQDVPADTPPREVIRQTLTNYLAAYVEHLGMITVIAHQAIVEPQVAELWEGIHSDINSRHTRFLDRLVREGNASPSVPTEMLVEATSGIVMRFAELIVRRPEQRDHLMEEFVALHFALSHISDPEPEPSTVAAGDRTPAV